jgi:hypothetical protein
MTGSYLELIFPLLWLALMVFILWQVISQLNRIRKSVEEIAQTLRRIESKEPRSSPNI